jgi:hypothetical protein
MATYRLFTELVVSIAMLMATISSGIATAAPVADTDRCVASTSALRRLAIPASQRYLTFKQAQIEQGSAADALGSDTEDCEPSENIASPVARGPLGYAAFKDLQAGNDILQADTKGMSEVLAAQFGSSLGVSAADPNSLGIAREIRD